MQDMIYLDHQATTPVDPRVLENMLPYFCEHFGNPSSATHAVGWKAKMAVENARVQVAKTIGAQPSEIVFTSGATEANNMALIGLIRALEKDKRKKAHILTSQTEHPAILKTFEAISNEFGVQAEVLPVNRYGQVEPEAIVNAIREETVLMSFIAANNEIGSINPLEKIGQIAKEKKVLFHTDATQAIGKFTIDVEKMGIDLLSLSAHKIYGPKGVGALFVRSREPHVHLKPLFFGGGQEQGLRSGTANVSGIVGLGSACELCCVQLEDDNKHYTQLRDAFLEELSQCEENFQLNGHPVERILNNIHISFFAGNNSSAVAKLGTIACSAGSACSSTKGGHSHVLAAIGIDAEMAGRSLRIGFGRINTEEQVRAAARKISSAYCDG